MNNDDDDIIDESLPSRFLAAGQAEIGERLTLFGVPFESTGWDDYDNSLEIYGVSPEHRLSAECLEYLLGLGFSVIYVNHTDKWETHYKASRSWRVSYPHKRGPNEAGILVEERIDSWPQEWFETGYAKVVDKETSK